MKSISLVMLLALGFVVPLEVSLAGSISADLRAEMESNDYDSNDTSNKDNYRFNVPIARLDAKGKLNEQVAFRLRFRLSKPAVAKVTTATGSTSGKPANSSRDSLNDSIDLAFVTNQFSEAFALTLGKFGSEIGGVEGNTSAADLYMQTKYCEATGANRYHSGVKGAFSFNDQEISLQAANLSSDATHGTDGKFNQNRNLWALVYKGSFMDKALSPIVSYHLESPQETGTTDKRKDSYLTAGVKFEDDVFSVEADYSLAKYENKTSVDKDDELSTAQVGFAYKAGSWTPRLKIESSINKVYTSGQESKKTYTGVQAGVEYKPVKEEMFRYHAMYWQREEKPEGGTAITDKHFVVGTKILADFLK